MMGEMVLHGDAERLYGFWADKARLVPGIEGYPLFGGWNNVASSAWFAVLALTYKDQEIESRIVGGA